MEGNPNQYRVDRADALAGYYLTELEAGDPDDWGDLVTDLLTDFCFAAKAFLGSMHAERIMHRSLDRALARMHEET